ncbi:MAG: MauE/DoxX family redox-associated membrane protein, partial [Actinomycetota bacterium]
MSHEMDALLALSRLVLAGVFGGAGIAKLVRPGAAGTAAADLGVPPRLRRPAALGLPLVEVVVAVALVAPPPWGWWGAVGALGLLVAFTTAVALAVVRGRAAGCRCFGQREPAPSGVGSLVRNQLLVGLAVLVVWQGPTGSGPPVLGWLGGLPPLRSLALAVGGVAVAAVARLIWRRPAATRSTGTRSLRSEDAGAPAGPRVVLRSHRPELTIGMATFRDFDGVYFTLQSMRLYQDLEGTELVVVDNEGCSDTQRFVEGWTGGRYVL